MPIGTCVQCNSQGVNILPRRQLCKTCKNREQYEILKKSDKYIVHRLRCAERYRRLARERTTPVVICVFDETLL